MGLPSWLGGKKKATPPPDVAPAPALAPPPIPSARPTTDAGLAATNAARRARGAAAGPLPGTALAGKRRLVQGDVAKDYPAASGAPGRKKMLARAMGSL